MLKKLGSILLGFIALFFLISPPVLAQVSDEEIAAGLESCFDYYEYGNVEVNLATGNSSYKPGEKAEIIGTIVNKNSFPLNDVVVYAQLRRMNETGDVTNEGHHLLERKVITSPLNLLPNESRFVNAEFPILDGYPNGAYQLQYYVASRKGFHYAGRPFLEEDYGGSSLFDIQGSAAPLVFFSLNGVRVNQQAAAIRSVTPEYSSDTISISAAITDNRTSKTDVPVTVKFYSFEDTFEEYLVPNQSRSVTSQNGLVNVQFTPPGAGAYVMVMRTESPSVSELKFRFAKVGGSTPTLRINDIGTTNYPPGQNDKAYVCFHSPAPANTPQTALTLRILDEGRNVVGEKSISRQFSGNVLAISLPFEGLKDNRNFYVQANVNQGGSTKNIETHYSCDIFSTSPKDLSVSFSSGKLGIDAVNSCEEKVSSEGYVDSIIVKNNKGEVVKEFYNTEAFENDVEIKDLPAGEYVAEVKSGELSKNYEFRVAGLATTIWGQVLAGLVIVAVLAGGFGVYYYIMRRHKKDQVV